MKKRSNPIPLLSAAVLCFGMIGWLNYRSTSAAHPEIPQQQQQPDPPAGTPNALGAERPAVSAMELKKHLNLGSGKTPGPPARAFGNGPVIGAKFSPKNEEPTAPPKPKPNDSQISSHWYSPESNAGSTTH